MKGVTGAWKIVRFNWPWYAIATATTIALATLSSSLDGDAGRRLAFAGSILAGGWTVLSVLVSHLVYDRSDVARGGWLDDLPARTVGVFHFGQDEASALVARVRPAATLRTFDVHDPSRSGSPSLRRARAARRDPTSVATAALDRVPLADGSLDLAVLAFAAHEVRDHRARVALFVELARVVGSGRIVVLEHLRDGWNLLAYGPGAFHFLSARTWHATFAAAGLAVVAESTVTPWVRRFELARAGGAR
jgi:hypothetical protein